MQPRTTARVSLTALLGTPVTDAQGHLRGRLKDIAVATGPDAGKVAGLVLKTRAGLCDCALAGGDGDAGRHAGAALFGALVPLQDQGNYLYLQQDLVDRQIIDIHGRKVVRVNDVDLEWMGHGRGASAARGRGGDWDCAGRFAAYSKACCRARRWNRFRASSARTAFPGTLWT